jgi:hypothetical protein
MIRGLDPALLQKGRVDRPERFRLNSVPVVLKGRGNVNFGGRICLLTERPGCLVCYGWLDVNEATRDLEDQQDRENRRDIY